MNARPTRKPLVKHVAIFLQIQRGDIPLAQFEDERLLRQAIADWLQAHGLQNAVLEIEISTPPLA